MKKIILLSMFIAIAIGTQASETQAARSTKVVSFIGGGSGCNTPTGLISGAVTSASAKVKWNHICSDDPDHDCTYQVYYRPTGTTTWLKKSTGSKSTVLSGLTPSTTYEVKVRAKCTEPGEVHYSAFTAIITFTTAAMRLTEAPSAILVYPNPNQGEFIVNLAGYRGETIISVFDNTGKIIASETILDPAVNSLYSVHLDGFSGTAYVRVSDNTHFSAQVITVAK